MKKIALFLIAAVLALCSLAQEARAGGRAVVVRGRSNVIVSRPFVGHGHHYHRSAFFGGYGYGAAFVAPVVVQDYYAAPAVAPVVAPVAAPVAAAPVVAPVAVQAVVTPAYYPVVIRQRAFISGHGGFGYGHGGFGRGAVIIRRR